MAQGTMLAIALLIAMLTSAAPTVEAVPYQVEGIMANGIALKGVNWFGFNNGGTMVDGLWGGPGLMSDFATVVWRQKLLGFNAVRLPFSFQDLNKPPRSFRYDYCTPPSAQEVAASVTPPGRSPPASLPRLPAPPSSPSGKCNDYLPESSTFDRFVWVAQFYAKNGFYVLVDNHLREDQTALNDRAGWAAAWARLARALAADPVLKSKLLIDVLNEPDNFNLRWEATAGKPALKDLYLSAMDAIEGAVPGLTFLVEGTGNGGIFANWGDGFTTDGAVISEKGLSDARPFLQEVLSKPYRLRVVLSPHIYPPSVTNTDTNSAGAGLFNRLSTSFGENDCWLVHHEPSNQLSSAQFSSSKTPLLTCKARIADFRYQDDRGVLRSGRLPALWRCRWRVWFPLCRLPDLTTMQDLAHYFNNQGAAADGRHAPVNNWFYWSWNANR